MKILIIIIIFPLILYSKNFSDSVEDNHIYLTDSSTTVKVYKEAIGNINPFGIINYFSITIPQNSFFRLSLYSINKLNQAKFEKIIYQGDLKPGIYRISDSELGTKYRGSYYYCINILDSIQF